MLQTHLRPPVYIEYILTIYIHTRVLTPHKCVVSTRGNVSVTVEEGSASATAVIGLFDSLFGLSRARKQTYPAQESKFNDDLYVQNVYEKADDDVICNLVPGILHNGSIRKSHVNVATYVHISKQTPHMCVVS